MLKDFAFADSINLSDPEGLLHFARTPGPFSEETWVKSMHQGVVIHTQFAQWRRTQLKQAWYRCLELLFTKKKARHINLTYEITRDNIVNGIEPINNEWIQGLVFPVDIGEFESDWHSKEILDWFEEFGPKFFEKLDIWDIKILRDYFEEKTGRSPGKPSYPSILRKNVSLIRKKYV